MKLPRMNMPARYITACALCATGGFLLGVDTSIIGPVTNMKSYTDHFGHQSAPMHGMIVSCILISAAVSSFFAGWPADTLGRPRALALGAAVFCIGAALQAAAVSLPMFAAGRVIEGLGYGLYFGTQTVYICEISPPRFRGALVGYFTCYGTAKIVGSLSWRLPFIMLTALAVIYVTTTLFFLPASPRWLLSRGRGAEADEVWNLLGVQFADRRDVENEMANEPTGRDMNSILDETSKRPAVSNKEANFRDLWSRDVRKQTILATFLMGSLQLCGIDAVLYYAPLLFQQAGLRSAEASFLASGVSGIVIVATSIPALLLADKWGRRTSTLVGGLGLTLALLLIGSLYAGSAVHASRGAGRWVVIVCIYLYCVIQATTWAISIKVWAPEIQPQRTRAQAISLAHGVNWVANFFVAFICPILLEKSSWGPYFLFGGCTAVATVVSFFFMIETKGKSLGEIENAFGIKSTQEEVGQARMSQGERGVRFSENKTA